MWTSSMAESQRRPLALTKCPSLAGRIANPQASGYAASKFGVVGFSESLRREVAPLGMKVTVIEPGMVLSELQDHVTNKKARDNLRQRLQQVDPLEPGDIAAAVLFVVTQPPRVSVNELLLRPTLQER
jgi:NADP-dependent 3-hydroxy acid dehydrogenase YdfG